MTKPYPYSSPGILTLLLALIALFPVGAYGQQGSISLWPSQLPDFREVYPGHYSDVQFYEVSAQDISGSLKLTTQRPFHISLSCHTGYATSLTLMPEEGEIAATRIYVRMFVQDTGKKQGTIIHEVADIDPVSLPVSGTGVETLIPENYYQQATGIDSQLKTQLHQIISGHQEQSYTSLWTHFRSTDATFSGQVWDIYSDTPCQEPPYSFTFGDDQDRGSGGSQEGQFYNREHTMPRSWFGGTVAPMNTDLFHIFPTDKLVNAKRGSEPYGMVSNPSWTSLNGSKLGTNTTGNYAGPAFEPIDDYKGDLARVYFYMITRYEDQIESWTYNTGGNAMLSHNKYPGFEPWVIDMLIKWHEQDRVSQKEILRNHAIYLIQGNRNPFVDYPSFVQMIWSPTNVSTNPLEEPVAIKIFPNPATDRVQLESPEEMLKLEVVSLTGHQMRVFYPQTRSAQFSVSSLAPGIYFLRVHTSAGIHIKKMVKQ